MTLNKLRLLNFRNLLDFKEDLGKATVLLGPNTSGKTNLIEAIYLLATSRSFKRGLNQDLISFGKSFCKIESEIDKQERRFNLEILLSLVSEGDKGQKIKKEVRIDKKSKRPIFLLGNLLVVLFTPETLNMVLGSPSPRRQAIDLILIQISKKYTQNLIEFWKILKQRNRLLLKIKEGRARPSSLDFWDQGFLKTASFLRREREALLDSLNSLLPKNLRLSYLPSPKDALEGILKKERGREIEFGFSLFGPQKDDFVFLWRKKSLASFGSRGEIRQGAVFFKLAEREFIKQKTESMPVLLLDDVFSELDKKRREFLIDFLFQGQTILTTTSLSLLSPQIIKQAKIIELGKGAEANYVE